MELKSSSYHLGSPVSIVTLIKDLDYEVVKTEKEFALFEVNKTAWIYVKNYGSVVFINIPTEIKRKTLHALIDEQSELDDLPNEQFDIQIDPNAEVEISYGKITLPQISIDIAHVIALNMAQTVALDYFQSEVEKLLSVTTEYSYDLSQKGVLTGSRKTINKTSGKAMVLKNKIAENLYIFDFPDVVWNEPLLSKIDEQMRKDLEIDKRHQGVQLHLNLLTDNLDNYKSILQHKHSSTLEWIIILLIFIEIVHLFFG